MSIKKLFLTVLLFFCVISLSFAAQVQLEWDHSIDKPYLSNYKVYYGTDSNDYNPIIEDRASEYSVDGGVTWIPIPGSPPPISVDVEITGIKIKGLVNNKAYYFAVTAVDTRDFESDYSNEVTYTGQSMNICLTDMSEDNFDQSVDRRVVDHPFTVCWDSCEGAIGYELKIAHYFYKGLETEIVITTGSCYTFNNLPKSSRHFEVKVRVIYSETMGDWHSSGDNGSPKNWLIYSKPAIPGW